MTTPTPTDPMAMFRDMVAQWERYANEFGGQVLARPETAQAMHGATTAMLQVQTAVQDAMAKVLTAANMPTRSDIEALGVRLSAIEAALARIESGQTPTGQPAAKPGRGRKPDAA